MWAGLGAELDLLPIISITNLFITDKINYYQHYKSLFVQIILEGLLFSCISDMIHHKLNNTLFISCMIYISVVKDYTSIESIHCTRKDYVWFKS